MYHESLHFCVAEDVLGYFRERFIEEMDAEAIIVGLLKEDIIDRGDQRKIEKMDNPTRQNETLHLCLEQKCTREALVTVCDLIIAVKGNKVMKALGVDMKARLEGVCVCARIGVCVCACVHACVCVVCVYLQMLCVVCVCVQMYGVCGMSMLMYACSAFKVCLNLLLIVAIFEDR